MSSTLLWAIITVFIALFIYTIGVWGSKFTKGLRTWQMILFWVGLVFDGISTILMSSLIQGWKFDLHGLSGTAAFVLMLINAIAATVVLSRKDETAIRKFPTFSIIVWLIWLIPFISGLIAGMRR